MSSPPNQLETYLVPITVSFFFVTSSNGDPLVTEHLCEYHINPLINYNYFISIHQVQWVFFDKDLTTSPEFLMMVTLHEESKLLKHRTGVSLIFSYHRMKRLKIEKATHNWMIWMFLLSTPICWCYSWYHVVPLLVFAKPKCWSYTTSYHEFKCDACDACDAFEVMNWCWTKPNCKHSNKNFRSSLPSGNLT